MTLLHIGSKAGDGAFKLPLELVTQSVAILAKKRVGKSYTAAVIAEELLGAGQQVVIIDPTGAHWGLRSSADGKSAGFPIVVIGGDHADLPLEEHAGEALARAVVERRFSAIIDLTLLRKGAATRFLGAFFETLYRLNRQPLHLVCDEADAYAPQKPFAEEARTLGAMEDIVRRGGIRGIGTTLITQRPAVINKNVLTQCEILIALRLVHPKDIAAVMEWINVHAEPAQAKRMLDSLPSLPIGHAWFWAPGWGDIFERISVRRRKTFDSGATPKPGERVVAPKVLAPIDLERLGDEIKATAEKAKADDPKELRRRIGELERQLAAKPAAAPASKEQLEEAYNRGLRTGQMAADKIIERIRARLERARAQASMLVEEIAQAFAALDTREPTLTFPKSLQVTRPPTLNLESGVSRTVAPGKHPSDIAELRKSQDGTGLPAGERKILTAVAQHVGGCSREQISILVGLKRSTRDRYLQYLQQKGFVDCSGDRITPTEAGFAALGSDFEPLPTGDALREHWLAKLPDGERRILEVLAAAYPDSVDRERISTTVGLQRSTRDRYIQYLQARKLVKPEGRGAVVASEELFG